MTTTTTQEAADQLRELGMVATQQVVDLLTDLSPSVDEVVSEWSGQEEIDFLAALGTLRLKHVPGARWARLAQHFHEHFVGYVEPRWIANLDDQEGQVIASVVLDVCEQAERTVWDILPWARDPRVFPEVSQARQALKLIWERRSWRPGSHDVGKDEAVACAVGMGQLGASSNEFRTWVRDNHLALTDEADEVRSDIPPAVLIEAFAGTASLDELGKSSETDEQVLSETLSWVVPLATRDSLAASARIIAAGAARTRHL